MNFHDAFADAVLRTDAPAITEFELYILGQGLFAEGVWDGEKLTRGPRAWDSTRATRAVNRLFARRVIAEDADFRSGVYRIVQSTRAGSAEEVACIADPFCYVSHLSAMQRYGLTDRTPQALHLSTPARPLWNKLWAAQCAPKLREDLGGEFLPGFARPGFKNQLRRREVIVHETVHPGEPIDVRGERTRIASVGRTFADMLIEPGLCGGMRHVIEVWEREAGDWAEMIIPEVDRVHGPRTDIVKVRAGYLLQERLGMTDPRVLAWKAFAQRGGSRKLDPEGDYAPTFSADWMISLNV